MPWLIAAGVYNLGFGLFHLTFWRLLKWKEQLPLLSRNNQAVMQALNLCLAFFLFLGGYLFLAYPDQIATSGLGRAVAMGMLAFWILRTVVQVALFDLKRRVQRVLLVIFILGIVVHGAAAYL